MSYAQALAQLRGTQKLAGWIPRPPSRETSGVPRHLAPEFKHLTVPWVPSASAARQVRRGLAQALFERWQEAP